jgi:hypothetical protein
MAGAMPPIIRPDEQHRFAPGTDYVEMVFSRPSHGGTAQFYGASGSKQESFDNIYSYRKALESRGWSYMGGDQNADGGVFYFKLERA